MPVFKDSNCKLDDSHMPRRDCHWDAMHVERSGFEVFFSEVNVCKRKESCVSNVGKWWRTLIRSLCESVSVEKRV